MSFLLLACATCMTYVVSNQSSASRSNASLQTAALAEAGLNYTQSILANPVNRVNHTTGPVGSGSVVNLPGAQRAAAQATLHGGSVYYWGTYDPASGNSTLFGKGVSRNPASRGSIARTTSSRMHVVPGQSTQQVGVWNQLFSNALPPASNVNACTTNIANGTFGVMESADIYVRGNLCMTGPRRRWNHTPRSVV